MNKHQAYLTFTEQYDGLKEGEKTTFTRIFNKLLQVNYLTKNKLIDNNDYHTILALSELFSSFFKLAGFTLEIKKETGVIYIKNDEQQNHLNLKKITTVILLALRLLYQEKKDLVTLGEDIEIYLSELHDKLSEVAFIDNKRVTKKDLKPEIDFLKRFNIINFNDPDLQDSARIKIYPTILYVLEIETIKDIVDRLEGLTKNIKEETNEEAD
ncbi:MAG: DUF4194 domain-containing protein [Acholeplasmatales bacterium]|jgi:hypothetical protein|nr:DUF4194 domain-containing protein [Acholeplasmatales bacterium]